jgi:hypothetical protein
MKAHINFTALFDGEPLKPDGSNFIYWYQHLRSLLKRSIFTIIEPLVPVPNDDAYEGDKDTFRDRWDYYTLVETAILSSMVPEMRAWLYTIEPNLVIGDLKHHFESQVWLMVYDRLNKFYTLKMEEHISVGLHLAKMHRIHRHLILEFDHEILDPLANIAVLRSLPPSYRSFIEEFVMGGESVTFDELVARVRSLKVDCIQGEIVDLTGICDIQCYKRFINTYAVLKYEILIPVL